MHPSGASAEIIMLTFCAHHFLVFKKNNLNKYVCTSPQTEFTFTSFGDVFKLEPTYFSAVVVCHDQDCVSSLLLHVLLSIHFPQILGGVTQT